MSASSARAVETCPKEGRRELLQERPERLLGCEQESAIVDRVWAAHALTQLTRFEEAGLLFAKLGTEEELPSSRAALLLSASYNELRAGQAAKGLTHLRAISSARRWVKTEVAAARADLLFGAGDLGAAATAAQDALSAGPTTPDVLRQLLVRIAVARNDTAAFASMLRKMMLESPGSPLTATALQLAKGDFKVPTLTTSDLAARWERWSQRGGAQSVADECLPRLATLSDDGAGMRARFECGVALSTIKHAEAERVLKETVDDPSLQAKALLAIARIQSRGNDAKRVGETCRGIRPGHTHEAAECAFLTAFIYQQQGKRPEAQAGFETVIHSYPHHNRARDAAWFLAFDAYQHDREHAVSRFDALLKLSSGDDRVQVLYWRGRAQADADAAREDWTSVTRLDPFGYYGWLAASRLGEAMAPSPSDACGAKPALTAATPPAGAKDAARLLELGFSRFAALELNEAVPKKSRDALGWRTFLENADQFERVVLIGMGQGGHGGPWPAPPDRRTVIEAAFPRAFPNAIAKALPVDRCLLLSLMRRESRFDPNATSAAQARGLLQLLPKTAEQVAKDFAQEPPTADHLYDPQTNVLVASQYVKKLFDRFGHPLLVAAAYNGGPGAVAKWTTDMAGVDFDEFVERIPFRETRNYVKAVGGAYAAYSLIYGGKRPTISLDPVKPAPATGVNY